MNAFKLETTVEGASSRAAHGSPTLGEITPSVGSGMPLGVGGVRPYYDAEGVTIYHADCRDIMPLLGKFDLMMTDPPYGLGKKLHGGSWGTKGETWDDSAPDMTALLQACGKACIWGGNYFGLPISRGWLVWIKPDANGHIGKAELAWTTEDRVIHYLPHTIAATNAERNGHPTLKPLRVIAWSMSFFADCKTVIDPFAGSGTTGRVAKDLGKKCVLIEREERYCEIAARRMAQSVLSLGGGGAELAGDDDGESQSRASSHTSVLPKQ